MVAMERELVLAQQELAQQELSVTRDELTRLRQELVRLQGIGIESLGRRGSWCSCRSSWRKGCDVSGKLRCGATLRKEASQTKSFICPIGCELMREPVMAAGHTYERVQIEE